MLETLQAYDALGVNVLIKSGDGMGVFLTQNNATNTERNQNEVTRALTSYLKGFFQAVQEFYSDDVDEKNLKKIVFMTIDRSLENLFNDKKQEFLKTLSDDNEKNKYKNVTFKLSTICHETVKEFSENGSQKLGVTIAPNGNQEFLGSALSDGNVLEETIAMTSNIAVIGNSKANPEIKKHIFDLKQLKDINAGEYAPVVGSLDYPDLYKDNDSARSFYQGIESQTDNPQPDSAYRGIGVKATKVEGGYRIDEVFSSDNGRFFDVNNRRNKVDPPAIGEIITQISKDGGENWQQVSSMTDVDLASYFHQEGEVFFKTQDNAGNIKGFKCDNRNNKKAIFAPTSLDKSSFSTLSEQIEEVRLDPTKQNHVLKNINEAISRGVVKPSSSPEIAGAGRFAEPGGGVWERSGGC